MSVNCCAVRNAASAGSGCSICSPRFPSASRCSTRTGCSTAGFPVPPLFGWAGAMVCASSWAWRYLLRRRIGRSLTENVTARARAAEPVAVVADLPGYQVDARVRHACATRAWGGEVHEMRIMILVLMPIPYVDASAASAFREPQRRVLVGAAGMVVELFVASLALFLWLEVEHGIARAVLFNVMLIAGISTVLFNANPLLRFDGYYMLADSDADPEPACPREPVPRLPGRNTAVRIATAGVRSKPRRAPLVRGFRHRFLHLPHVPDDRDRESSSPANIS